MYNRDVFSERYSDQIICGDSWSIAQSLPNNLARTIITSPPYFGHRRYSQSSETEPLEFGCEEEPKEYVIKLVSLFDKLKSFLQEDGTLWLNLGDTYRNGQLLGIPWRTAIALQDAGWMLRSEIIWNKPNAMPSSVKNRPTVAHEHIFLFSKKSQYFYNADAIREPHITFSEDSKMKGGRNHFGKRDGTPELGKNSGNSNLHTARWDQAFHPLGRNKRTVWDIPLGKFREAHFAVFPPELVKLCLLAGSEPEDLVYDPFMGSGTVAIVAKQNNRSFLGSELVPEYVEMAQKRLSLTQASLLMSL
ncbi:MAG: DNA-methyltransferase [Janthinobacterium lividum]